MYVTIIGRSPDPPGLRTWTDMGYVDSTIWSIASRSEPANLYNCYQDVKTIVSLTYQNAFNRTVDDGGLTFWTERFSNGSYDKTGEKLGTFFKDFVASAVGSDAVALKKREDVAGYWTLQLVNHHCPWDDFGRTVLQQVGENSDVSVAKAAIDTKIQQMEGQKLSGTYVKPNDPPYTCAAPWATP
jgi:hypothetical protein